MALNTQTSVVDYLKSTGKDSSYASRSKLAAQYGITGYSGSASQNLQLMSFLQGGGDTGKGLNTIINSDQPKVQEQARATTDTPPTRTKATETYQKPSDILPDRQAPEAPNFEETYAKLRQQYGVTDLENTLNDLTLQARTIQATTRQRVDVETGKPVAMNVIEGRVSEVEKQQNERLDAVLRETEYYSNQVKNSYAVIDSIMKLKDMDYDNAKASYDSEFDRTLKVLQYGQDAEDAALSREKQASDAARANLQIIYNNITAGGADFDSLAPADIATIAKLEVQSGLPQGFIQTLKSKNPKADIVSSSTRQDSSGAKYTDIVMRGEDGAMTVQSIYLGKERLPESAGGGKPTEAETERSARSKVSGYLNGRTGSDGYVAPEDYVAARNAWTQDGFSRVDFDDEFKSLVNPKSRTKVGISF